MHTYCARNYINSSLCFKIYLRISTPNEIFQEQRILGVLDEKSFYAIEIKKNAENF